MFFLSSLASTIDSSPRKTNVSSWFSQWT